MPRNAPQQPQHSGILAEWHESLIEYLCQRSGLQTTREPIIDGKTPDILVEPPKGQSKIIIECIYRQRNPCCPNGTWTVQPRHYHTTSLEADYQAIYSRLEEKATKYDSILLNTAYIIALYDDECVIAHHDRAFDLAFSHIEPHLHIHSDRTVTRHQNDLWSSEQQEGIFHKYPQVSGMLYSYWPRQHFLLPNPMANIKAQLTCSHSPTCQKLPYSTENQHGKHAPPQSTTTITSRQTHGGDRCNGLPAR